MKDKYQYERNDLGHVRASLRHLFVIVGLFSFLVNLLLLTGPLYMLHVYDYVLPYGAVQLGGTALTAYDTDNLGQYIGYLPQKMQLLPGTVAENITRYQTDPPQDLLFTAARNAGAFEMITQLPQGFDTDVCQLSGGQAQRIGLARALFGDPVLLVLDEPNSNLDNEGVAALNAAVRRFKRKGNTVLIIAHRPAAIQECDTLMVIESGQITAFGPKEDILRKMVKNHADISALSSRSQAPHAI